MKKKLLGLSLLSAVAFAQMASAQEYDNRWYISGTAGVLFPDSERADYTNNGDISEAMLWGVGVGKRFTPNIGLEFAWDYANPSLNDKQTGGNNTDWELNSFWVNARWYFLKDGWDPYVVGGLGVTQGKVDGLQDGVPGYDHDSTEFAAKLGVGIETDRRKRVDYRLEGGLRWDNSTVEYAGFTQVCTPSIPAVCTKRPDDLGSFLDYYVSASVLVKLGDLPVPVVAAPVDCSALDGDNDGVNDCLDKCPDSQPGQTIGADGCPVKLVIDLKGVNFDFDKATLRDDSVVILDEAVAVLNKYPQLRVAVDGHTDLCGAADYNQKLSEKRAGTVFQYLVDKGIATDRLVGPTGYGEAN
ncbi:MAG: outer membrane beta-barrel protein, partial [Shewanella sp.]